MDIILSNYLLNADFKSAFEYIYHHKIKTHIGIYMQILEYCSMEGEYDIADKIIDMIHENGDNENIVMYEYAVESCRESRNCDLIINFLEKLGTIGNNIEKDSKVYEIAVDICSHSKNCQYIDKILELMIIQKINMNHIIYEKIIDDECVKTELIMDVYINKDIKVTVPIYRKLIERLVNEDNYEKSMFIFNDMIEKGIQGDVIIYYNLIKICEKKGDMITVKRILDMMKK